MATEARVKMKAMVSFMILPPLVGSAGGRDLENAHAFYPFFVCYMKRRRHWRRSGVSRGECTLSSAKELIRYRNAPEASHPGSRVVEMRYQRSVAPRH
jgi:hypothetical protein